MSKMADLAGEYEQRHIRQSHFCAYLSDYDQCVGDEHCQYKLTTACTPRGPHFCGKDQILELEGVI